jgi:integrase
MPSSCKKISKAVTKQLFRKSLHTRDRKNALKKARYLWLIMTKLIDRYFKSPESYGKGMALLKTFHDIPDQEYSAIDKFLSELGEDEDELLNQAIEYRKASESYQEDLEIRLDEYKKLFALRQIEPNQPTYSAEENPKISELIEKWLRFKKPSLAISSFQSIQQSIYLFKEIVIEIEGTEPSVSQLTEITIRKFKELLEKLPPIRNSKKTAGKSFLQLSQLQLAPISLKTLKAKTTVASEFIKWVENEGYAVNDKLSKILAHVRRSTKQDNTDVLIFDENDLKVIFNSDNYKSGNIKRSSDYWVPLIALFTGARQGEICQLLVSDVYEKEKTWIIDINDENGNQLKSKNGSTRLVPVHRKLIELGLHTYVESLIKRGETKLFPDEARNKHGKFDAFQKRFSKSIIKLGIKENLNIKERKSFHSFRHTVRTKLAETSTYEAVIDSIVGHVSKDRSVGDRSYTHTDRIDQKIKALKKLTYSVDLTCIKKWDECLFNKSTLKSSPTGKKLALSRK